MFTRRLGRSNLKVSALGMGCWAIGGPFWSGDQPHGWGQVDDAQSLRALRRALELGVTFLDTADVYGAGHSERLVGQALAGQREQIILATKFGNVFDETSRQILGSDASPAYIQRACEASLRRLDTEYIDLYWLHRREFDAAQAAAIRDALEELVATGKIRYYGWSTDDAAQARVFAEGPHCTAVEHRINLFERNDAMLTVCDEFDLASVNRGPLAMGLLTGKFTPDSKLPPDDVRFKWNLREGTQAARLKQLERVRAVLIRDGRTLAQAALGWLWAFSPRTIPIPGFKTVQQVEENCGALDYGPLSPAQMREVEQLLGR